MELKKDSLPKQVSKLLLDQIEKGVYEVGDKIPPEPELMEEYKISRNTLREAIKELSAQGILEVRQGSGTYVKNKDTFHGNMVNKYQEVELKDIEEARELLEVRIGELASLRRDSDDLRHIEIALRNYKFECSVTNDMKFHLAIAKASHNELLYALYKSFLEYLESFLEEKVIRTLFSKDTIYRLHEELFFAIRMQNSSQAKIASQNILKL